MNHSKKSRRELKKGAAIQCVLIFLSFLPFWAMQLSSSPQKDISPEDVVGLEESQYQAQILESTFRMETVQ